MDEVAGIYARESSLLDRAVQLGIASGRVIDVSFPQEAPGDAESDHPLLDRVFEYLEGAEDEFQDVELALTVPTQQRDVLESARNIPYGETIDVERLARLAGLDPEDEEDLMAVRTALQENPTPIFIPDHRVDGASGATPPDVAETLRTLER